MEAFDVLQSNNYLKGGANGLRLKRPVKIYFPLAIIDQLKAIYNPERESGGIFELLPNGSGSLIVSGFHEIRNRAGLNYHYNPDQTVWNLKVSEIIAGGGLPMAVHTHPTKLGFDEYDSKRQTFYLQSSKPDQRIARNGIADNLQMPEAIFVKDERFGSGFGLSIYEGTIFPNSLASLSDAQLIILPAAFLLLRKYKVTKSLLAVLLAWFFVEFFRRPVYSYKKDGSLLISVSS